MSSDGIVNIQLGDGAGTVYGFAVGDVNQDDVQDVVAARSDASDLLFLSILPE